jgi:hypothetical protein
MSNAMFENDIVFNTPNCFYGNYSLIKCQNFPLGMNIYDIDYLVKLMKQNMICYSRKIIYKS